LLPRAASVAATGAAFAEHLARGSGATEATSESARVSRARRPHLAAGCGSRQRGHCLLVVFAVELEQTKNKCVRSHFRMHVTVLMVG